MDSALLLDTFYQGFITVLMLRFGTLNVNAYQISNGFEICSKLVIIRNFRSWNLIQDKFKLVMKFLSVVYNI